jgi:sensor histidine kinase YesM
VSRKNIIIFHIIFWIYILYPEFTPIIFKTAYKSIPYYFWTLPLNIFFHICIFYLFYFIFVPLFFRLKSRFTGVFIAVLAIIVYASFRLIIFYYYDLYVIKLPLKELVFSNWEIANEFRITVVLSLYAFFTRFTIDWFNHQKQKADLINQNQASELALLRSQINPHFLFNTLNNIYSLVIKKSDDASKALMKLSSIMRYMLYDANTDKVPLEKEIEYLNSFIELQKIRIKENNFIEFNITGNITNQVITPMLLIPFVENAFKHGNKSVHSPGIFINLMIEGDKIIFEVINYINKSENSGKDKIGGIGLQNIKRRLELIYPGEHSMEIKTEDNKFIIKLIIEN